MTELQNPLSVFLAGKIADSGNGVSILLSQEAAHQIIDELERQDKTINRAMTGLGAVLEAERRPRGKPCTCDNCLGSSRRCSMEAGERLGDLWYCRKQAETNLNDSGEKT